MIYVIREPDSDESMRLNRGFMLSIAILWLTVTMECARPRPSGPSRGNPGASTVILEFTDFDCASCREVQESLRRVLAGDRNVEIIFKSYPLVDTEAGRLPHIVGFCVNEQSSASFWMYYDLMFSPSRPARESFLESVASTLDLDAAKLRECAASPRASAAVTQDRALGDQMGVRGAPTFFAGRERMEGARSYAEFQKFIADARR